MPFHSVLILRYSNLNLKEQCLHYKLTSINDDFRTPNYTVHYVPTVRTNALLMSPARAYRHHRDFTPRLTIRPTHLIGSSLAGGPKG